MRLINEHVQGLDRRKRRSLKQQDVNEMAIQLGHGKYGMFVEEFKLPQDVDWQDIEPSYEDGVLRIVLPKRPLQSYPCKAANPRIERMAFPGSFYGGPHAFLW